MMEGFNFFEHPRPRVSRDLFDHLYSIFNVGVNVDACLDGGVGPFAEDLARQFV